MASQVPPKPSFIGPDGTFTVKPGDMISKYCMTIYGNYGSKDTTWPKFFRFDKSGKTPKTIDDYNLIYANEKLGHWDYYKPQGGGVGGGGGGTPVGTTPAPSSVPKGPPVNLSNGPVTFDISREFAYTAVVPLDKPAYSKWFSWQWQIDLSGKIYQTGGPTTVTISTQDVKAAIDTNLKDRFGVPAVIKTELSREQLFEKIMPAYRTGDPYRFANAIFECFSLVLQVPPGGVTVAPTDQVSINNSVEMSLKLNPLIPFYVGIVTTQTVKDVWIRGSKYTIEIQGKGGLNFGPSPLVWIDLARQGGMFVLRNMARAIGTELVSALTAEGTIIAGVATVGVAYAAVLTYLMGWAYGWAKEQGEIEGLVTWYVSRYRTLVFDDGFTQPRIEHMWGTSQEERERMLRNAKDVVAKATADCEKNVRERLTNEQHPAASQDLSTMYKAYAGFLIMEAGGDVVAARKALETDLEPKARQILQK